MLVFNTTKKKSMIAEIIGTYAVILNHVSSHLATATIRTQNKRCNISEMFD